jgi:tetratricopeptide (TPR) repeat protein
MQDAETHGERGFHVRALLQYAAALAARSDTHDAAERAYHRALALAQPLGMQPWAALAQQGLAAVYRARGQHQLAHTALDAALAIWRTLGVPRRIAQVESLTAQLTAA